MDVLHHLAAGGAGEAGLACARALHRGGGIARRAEPVAASAEDERVRERAACGGGTKTRGAIGFCKVEQLHAFLREQSNNLPLSISQNRAACKKYHCLLA